MQVTRQQAVDLLALVLILAALAVALTKTAGLTAPYDTWDHFRDIALAQTVRDGAPLSDQYYRDEWLWYNPLLPWTLALGSAMTNTTVEVFHVRAGPWLNLLGPLAFYFLGVRWIGRTAAFMALAVYLFFGIGNGPGWAYATYSPWLYSNDFAEGIFFAAALALQLASDRPTMARAVCAGALIGLTFLAHTAPALILVAMACAAFARRWPMLLTMGAVAFVVASPFLYSIGLQYHFRVINTTPLSWVWGELRTLDALPQFLKNNALLVGLAAFGAVITPSRLLLVWLATTIVLLLYAVSSTTPVVPAFHFWKWTTAAMTLLSGTTLAWLCSATPVHPWAAVRESPFPSLGVNFIAVSLTVAAVVWHWPVYANRDDFSLREERRGRDMVDAVAFFARNHGTHRRSAWGRRRSHGHHRPRRSEDGCSRPVPGQSVCAALSTRTRPEQHAGRDRGRGRTNLQRTRAPVPGDYCGFIGFRSVRRRIPHVASPGALRRCLHLWFRPISKPGSRFQEVVMLAMRPCSGCTLVCAGLEAGAPVR